MHPEDLIAGFQRRRLREDRRYIQRIREELRSIGRSGVASNEPVPLAGALPASTRKKPPVSDLSPIVQPEGKMNPHRPNRPRSATWSLSITRLDLRLADGSQPAVIVVMDQDARWLNPTGSCNQDNVIEQLDSLLLTNPKPNSIVVTSDGLSQIPELKKWSIAQGISICIQGLRTSA